MPLFSTHAGKLRTRARTLLRPTLLLPLVTGVVALSAAVFAEGQNREIHTQTQRTDVLNALSVLRAELEGYINGNVQLVQGLVAVISTEPDLEQERFAAIGQQLFSQPNQLRNIAAAPDLVVSMVYPLAGNEGALGLDYMQNPAQRIAVMQTIAERRMVLAGPVDLVQGGTGFIARYPVFVTEDGEDQVWGIASAVIDAEVLYAESGLLDAGSELGLDVSVSGRDGAGEDGAVFFGSPDILSADPVSLDVLLPNGSWRLWAVPQGGWDTHPANTWLLRIGMLIAGCLLVIPLVLAVRLNEERRRRIIDQKRREEDLVRLSRRLELALDASQVAVWEINLATGILKWDDRMFEIYGLDPRRATHDFDQWSDRIHPEDKALALRDFGRCVENGDRYVSTFRVITETGEIRHVRAIGARYQDAGSSPRIIGVNWDATSDAMLHDALLSAKDQAEAKARELESAQARIEHNALHDSLTGLPNRRYLDHMLDTEIGRSVRRGEDAALLHIDLDRFKQINDTLGHAAGDAMLVHAAEILKGCAGPHDFVARIGGDEFVVLTTARHDRDCLAGIARNIITEMGKPVFYQSHECRFGVSVGIASTDGGQADARQLLINADIALYRAKRMGRNRFEFFSQALQADIVKTKRLGDEILCALDADEFCAYYQPQFDAETLELVGAEVLVRWNHPTRGLLTPDKFLDVADDLNVTATLDRMVLERAVADRAMWAAGGIALQRVAVNVSARRLHDENLISGLRALDLPRNQFSFELVESIYLDENDDIVSFNIEQLRELGIGIEIDDFGTGYASIVSLLKISPTRLKIDRQLIAPIVDSDRQRRLVSSIIDIGRALGIEVLAEGVETRQHIALLRQMGCRTLQGYALARPMPAADLLDFARGQSWRPTG